MAVISPYEGSSTQSDRPSLRATDTRIRLSYFLLGFAPIGSLALSILGLVPLNFGGPILVAAAITAGCAIACNHPQYRRLVVSGLGYGLVAVTIYDMTRIPFVVFGGWPDFIPKIGIWLFDNPDTNWTVGYLWRYLGNGAGMGMAFKMVAPLAGHWVRQRVAGVAFGLAIWTGLVITLIVAPDGQSQLFALTPATIALSLLGHIVYGSVLGCTGHMAVQPSPKTASVIGLSAHSPINL